MKRGLCGSSRDLQRKVGPHHALGLGLNGTRTEAVLADPGAAVPDIAAGAGTTAPNAAGPVDDPGTRVAISIVVTAAVAAADARPALSATTTVSVPAAGAGVPVSATAAVSVAAAGAGVPVSTAAVVSVAVARASVPVSATAAAISVAAARAGVPVSAVAAISVAAAGRAFPSPPPLLSLSRLLGSAVEAEGEKGVGFGPVPDCGTPPPIAAVEATSAGGPAASPTTPPLATGGVTARPGEVVDTRSAFFGANSAMKSRGAAL
nr:calphotin-like [Setaria viridis]